MLELRRLLLTAVLITASCASFPNANSVARAADPPLVEAGFYAIDGGGACADAYGSVAFAPAEGSRFVTIGGGVRSVSLRREANGSFTIDGTGCAATFVGNSLATIGIGARVLSHRGDTRIYPANTLGAFESAMAQGFGGFELDVRLSSDGVAIVSHDDNLGVATNCRGRLARSASDEIARCLAIRTPLFPESRFLARRARLPEPVPTLRQAVDRFGDDPRVQQIVVDIKIKDGGERLVSALQAAMSSCREPDCQAIQRRLTFISQDRADIALLNRAFPGASIALESNATVSGLIDEPGDHWANTDYDIFSLSFNSLFDIRLKLVKLLRGENLTPVRRFRRFYERNRADPRSRRLLGWTINNGVGVRALRQYAFEDVLTDLTLEQFVRKAMAGLPPRQ